MKIFSLALLTLAFSTLAYAKEVTLKWKPIEGAKKYNLEISDETSFENKIFTKTLSQPSFAHDLKSGIYYLRVQGVDPRGKAGLWSPPFKMVVTTPISPVANTEVPQKVVFVEKKPDVDTTWKTTENASHFKVKVLKDGKEILSQETTSPHLNFKPSGPGDYKVIVSSGFQQYFGPGVTVNTIHVEKKELAAPEWETPENKKFNSRRPINLAWTPVDTARTYRVKIYRKADIGSREPATETPVFTTEKLENNQLIIDPLPTGKYYAIVESVSDEGTSVTSTKIDLEVKRVKPVEFEKFDVSARYNISPDSYSSNIYENGGTSNSSSVGGNVEISGNLWLPDSHWGVRAGGSWGGFTVNGSNITYNDLQAAAQYRLLPEENFLHSDIKPFFGARAWTLPLILGQTSGNNNNNNGIQVFPLTVAGPEIGFELVHPFSEKVAGVLLAQASFPITNSSLGNQAAANVRADFGVPSYKAEVGVKYALPGTLRLVAMAGYDDEQLQFSPFAGLGASGPAPSGVKDTITLKAPTFALGIEASDDGPLFRTAGSAHVKTDRFSDFDLTLRYAFESFNYFANIIESSNGSASGNGFGGGMVEFDGRGWFNESHHGIRLSADWVGFNDQGASITFPEFEVQWGLRPVIHATPMALTFDNFFGLRSWRVPVIEGSGNNNGQPQAASIFFRSPQLLGPSETIQLTKGLSETWTLRFLGEVSSPFTIVDKDATIDHVLPNDLSWKAEVQTIKTFNPDLSAGLGAGYSVSQMTYAPSQTFNNGSMISGTSYIQLAAPMISLFGNYSF